MARNHRPITMTGPPPWCLWCLRWCLANAGEAASIAANNKIRIFFFISAPVFTLRTLSGSNPWTPDWLAECAEVQASWGPSAHYGEEREAHPAADSSLPHLHEHPDAAEAGNLSRPVSPRELRPMQILPYVVQELPRMALQGLRRQCRSDRACLA
jgi:hypothetical protein